MPTTKSLNDLMLMFMQDVYYAERQILKALPKAMVTVVLCGVPEVAAMLAAGPAVLVKLNEVGVLTPLAAAETA